MFKLLLGLLGKGNGNKSVAGGSRGGDYCGVNIGTGSAEARSTDHCDIFSMVGANASSNALATDRDGTMHIFFGDLA